MIYGSHASKDGRAYNTFEDLHLVVRDAVATLKCHLNEFDSIVVRGMSGVVVGAPVALKLKKPLVVVRKDTDSDNHTKHRGREGKVLNLRNMGERVCFLDDLISTGRTKMAVHEAIQPDARIAVIYTYESDRVEVIA